MQRRPPTSGCSRRRSSRRRMASDWEGFYEALDPVRLLRQLESLQDAFWRHAVVGGLPAPLALQRSEETGAPVFDHQAVRSAGEVPLGDAPAAAAGEKIP